mmetsp:Transcript_25076/g.63031  ORF Transcript_25076/g.63031 Transcript_25076/m.63031 type:complete len:153 (-) Transcript_25076:90-548(-)
MECKDIVQVTHGPIDVAAMTDSVSADRAGAVSTFLGTTRNTFQGKEVLYLEYEAYEAMALSEMQRVIDKTRAQWDVVHCAIWHRIGRVDVREVSVMIAVSSVHRREGLAAVAFAIDELKATVPIWKKEVYADGSTWKQNEEWQAGRKRCCGH